MADIDITTPPTAAQWVRARAQAGHTYAQMAAAVGVQDRQAKRWAYGQAQAPLAAWWLYLLRTGQITIQQLPAIPARTRSRKEKS